jgi:peptidoglycan/xylan/chitin deacetylase (PgdA/CDA1 family)
MVRNLVKYTLRVTSAWIYSLQSTFFSANKILLTFYFHNLFREPSEIDLNEILPQQKLTVHQFRQFVEYFLEMGFHFISPDDLMKDNIASHKNVLINFDDGYFSSLQVLPILKEYNVPACYLVVANNIKENKLFWWDVLYRERRKRGTAEKSILLEISWLEHSKLAEEIERYISNEFGKEVWQETGGVDRPLTTSELKSLSQNKLITIGNHTCDHLILPLYSDVEIKSQIEDAQVIISELTGSKPYIISYPNGEYDQRVVEISKAAGLVLGFTCDQRFNYLPLVSNKQDPMRLGRYLFFGSSDFPFGLDIFRPEMFLYYKIRDVRRRWANR